MGDGSGGAPVLEAVLDALVGALEATAVAFYVEDATAGGLVVRCRRPAGMARTLRTSSCRRASAARPWGAIGVALPDGARLTDDDRVVVGAVGQALALAVRNDDLMRGLGDRLRELDRQALQLSALTRVARRVAETVDEGDARRVVVAEARTLLQADAAVLLVRGPAGEPVAAAAEGDPDGSTMRI